MGKAITLEERRLINEAIREGKVVKCLQGAASDWETLSLAEKRNRLMTNNKRWVVRGSDKWQFK